MKTVAWLRVEVEHDDAMDAQEVRAAIEDVFEPDLVEARTKAADGEVFVHYVFAGGDVEKLDRFYGVAECPPPLDEGRSHAVSFTTVDGDGSVRNLTRAQAQALRASMARDPAVSRVEIFERE